MSVHMCYDILYACQIPRVSALYSNIHLCDTIAKKQYSHNKVDV